MKIEKTSSEKLNAIQKQKKINYKKFKKIICYRFKIDMSQIH